MMRIEVEIAQARRVRPGLYVPALISLIITNPTGDKGPNEDAGPGLIPEVSIFVDLPAKRARDLAQELIRHVEMIEQAEENISDK